MSKVIPIEHFNPFYSLTGWTSLFFSTVDNSLIITDRSVNLDKFEEIRKKEDEGLVVKLEEVGTFYNYPVYHLNIVKENVSIDFTKPQSGGS